MILIESYCNIEGIKGFISSKLYKLSFVFRTQKFNNYFITLLNNNFSADDDIHSNIESFSLNFFVSYKKFISFVEMISIFFYNLHR